MRELTNKELNLIAGGVSGAVLTSIIKGATIIFELGRSLGSAVRRMMTKNYC